MNVSAKQFTIEYDKIMEKYADMVYRLAFVRTKSKSDSDDVLQEVFLRYLKVWRKMESEEHIKAMLLRITVNCSNSLSTSFWFKKTEPLDETLAGTENSPDGNYAVIFQMVGNPDWPFGSTAVKITVKEI